MTLTLTFRGVYVYSSARARTRNVVFRCTSAHNCHHELGVMADLLHAGTQMVPSRTYDLSEHVIACVCLVQTSSNLHTDRVPNTA